MACKNKSGRDVLYKYATAHEPYESRLAADILQSAGNIYLWLVKGGCVVLFAGCVECVFRDWQRWGCAHIYFQIFRQFNGNRPCQGLGKAVEGKEIDISHAFGARCVELRFSLRFILGPPTIALLIFGII